MVGRTKSARPFVWDNNTEMWPKLGIKTKKQQKEVAKIAPAREEKLNPRGKIFEGKVIRKFPKRITIEFERMIYVKKYEAADREPN